MSFESVGPEVYQYAPQPYSSLNTSPFFAKQPTNFINTPPTSYFSNFTPTYSQPSVSPNINFTSNNYQPSTPSALPNLGSFEYKVGRNNPPADMNHPKP
jgi:hypothetical protein